MFRRHTALLVMVVLLLVTAAPAFAAPSDCGLNCGASLLHRANPSGKGNFGQCHKLSLEDENVVKGNEEAVIEGKESREFNPSSQNQSSLGEADCRVASGRNDSWAAISLIKCNPLNEFPPGNPLDTPYAESQIRFQPSLLARASITCT